MRFNFLEVKREKDYVIFWLLLLLGISYTAGIFILVVLLQIVFLIMDSDGHHSNLLWSTFHWTLMHWYWWLILGFSVGFILWLHALFTSKDRVLFLFKAYPPNPEDAYHKCFMDIIEEVKIASGMKKIEPMVLPDTDVNAFSCEGGDGSVVIGVTEGALACFSRAELESIVAHEMGHVMAGDLLATTMFTSIISFYSGIKALGRKMLSSSFSYGGRASLGLILMAVPIYLVGQCWGIINSLLVLAISRQREYRADMLAVKIVRDPESLARALVKISMGKKSSKMINDKFMGSLFVDNPFQEPCEGDFEEDIGEDLLSGIWATHPPIKKRIEILCNIAGINREDIEKEVAEERKNEVRVLRGLVWIEDGSCDMGNSWMLYRDGSWLGPFTIEELLKIADLTDFVKEAEDASPVMVQDNPVLVAALREGSEGDKDSLHKGSEDLKGRRKQIICPRCSVPLRLADYEGVRVYACPQCYGILVQHLDVRKILVREEVGFDEEVKRWGDEILRTDEGLNDRGEFKRERSFLCPVCRGISLDNYQVNAYMYKRLVSNKFNIEVDVCPRCYRVWFDAKELEVLQYVVERLAKEKQLPLEEIINLFVGIC